MPFDLSSFLQSMGRGMAFPGTPQTSSFVNAQPYHFGSGPTGQDAVNAEPYYMNQYTDNPESYMRLLSTNGGEQSGMSTSNAPVSLLGPSVETPQTDMGVAGAGVGPASPYDYGSSSNAYPEQTMDPYGYQQQPSGEQGGRFGNFAGSFLYGMGAALASNRPGAGVPAMQQYTENKQRQNLIKQREAAGQRATEGAVRYLEKLGRNDLIALVRAGTIDGKTAMSMAGKDGQSADYGKTPIYGTDDQGNTVLGVVGSDGSFKKLDTQGFNIGAPVDKVDAGTHYLLYDKRTGQQIGTVPKENYQENFDKAAGSEAGKREAELPVLRSKAVSSLEDLGRQHAIVQDEIGQSIELLQKSPTMAAGLVGGWSKAVPGTPAYALAQKLESIKANVGFDKLQSMRENSPTGGALGQVSDFENRQLQAVMGNLEQAQDAQTIIYNLMRLQSIIEGGEQSRRDAFRRDFGEAPVTADPPNFGGGANPSGRTSSGIQWSVE